MPSSPLLSTRFQILPRNYPGGGTDLLIGPGGFTQAVDTHFNGVQIILLLISADFISMKSEEMQRALERYQQGKTRIIPILLRPVNWESTPIAFLSPLPTNGQPITQWSDLDVAFTDVSKDIREVIQELRVASGKTEPPANPLERKVCEKSNHELDSIVLAISTCGHAR